MALHSAEEVDLVEKVREIHRGVIKTMPDHRVEEELAELTARADPDDVMDQLVLGEYEREALRRGLVTNPKKKGKRIISGKVPKGLSRTLAKRRAKAKQNPIRHTIPKTSHTLRRGYRPTWTDIWGDGSEFGKVFYGQKWTVRIIEDKEGHEVTFGPSGSEDDREWLYFTGTGDGDTQEILDEVETRIKDLSKNPCIGLHFHAKDANQLLEAAEKANKRQGNPKKKTARRRKNPDFVYDIPSMRNANAPPEFLEVVEIAEKGAKESFAIHDEWGTMTASWDEDEQSGSLGDSLERGLTPALWYRRGYWSIVAARDEWKIHFPLSFEDAKRRARSLLLDAAKSAAASTGWEWEMTAEDYEYFESPEYFEYLESLESNPRKKKTKTLKGRAKRAEKKIGSAAKRAGKRIKKDAKSAGKDVKKFAKTKTGYGALGAGAGALLLGPIGAIAGAVGGSALYDNPPRRNPTKAQHHSRGDRKWNMFEEAWGSYTISNSPEDLLAAYTAAVEAELHYAHAGVENDDGRGYGPAGAEAAGIRSTIFERIEG